MTQAPLDKRSFTPLYVQLADRLTQDIHSGGHQPGDRLPSENELIRNFEISRITVRMAMQRLVADGVVMRERGRGTFVPRLDQRVGFTRCLEEEMNVQGIPWSVRLLTSRVAAAPREIAQVLHVSEGSSLFYFERLRLIKERVIGWEFRYLPSSLAERVDKDEFKNAPSVTIMEKAAEGPIDELAVTVLCRRLGKAGAKALGVPVGEPALVRQTVYRSRGRPVGYGECQYRADRFQFTYTLGPGSSTPTSLVV